MGEDDGGVVAAAVGEIDGGVGAAVVDKHVGSGWGWGRDRGRMVSTRGHRRGLWRGGGGREEGSRRGRGREGAAAGDGKLGLERGGGVDLNRIEI